MKRRIDGLREATKNAQNDVPEGVFLVRVERMQYHWRAQRPFYILLLSILQPCEFGGRTISSRLYCTSKALWKLSWFLRDFAYDTELLGRDELDEKALLGLRGIVKISHTTIHGIRVTNLDGFAPTSQWEELTTTSVAKTGSSEVA
jgi:hypothetical protein